MQPLLCPLAELHPVLPLVLLHAVGDGRAGPDGHGHGLGQEGLEVDLHQVALVRRPTWMGAQPMPINLQTMFLVKRVCLSF